MSANSQASPDGLMDENPSSFGEGDIQNMSLMDITPKMTKPWFMYQRMLQLNVVLLGAFLSYVVSDYDGSMVNGLEAVGKWEEYFNHPKVQFSIFNYDWMRYAILQSAAKDFGMFVSGRIILGVGGMISVCAGPLLLTECAYPTQRSVVTAMMSPSWPIGALVAALVIWAPYTSDSFKKSNWAWRLPSLLELALPLVQIVCAFFGPESPRWLIDKGREKAAREFFVKYHVNGDASHPLVVYEMAEITATIEEEKSQKLGRWVDWFRTKAMFHRFALCFIVSIFQQLSGNALISYYLPIILDNTGITSSLNQLRINLGLSAWSLICALGGAYIVGMFKRRQLFLTGYASMFVVYILFTAMSAVNQERDFKDKSLSIGVVFAIFLYDMTYQICGPVAIPYVMEICPYSMRAMGSMILQFASSISSLFNGYVNPIAMEAIAWKYYIVYIVWLAVEFTCVYFLYPETSGIELEEVNQVFNDGIVSGREAMEKAHKIDLNDPSKGHWEVQHREV